MSNQSKATEQPGQRAAGPLTGGAQLANLESQLDRFSLSLHQWQEAQAHLQPMESQLSQLLQQGGEILERLSATDERHAQAVGDVEARLSEWRAIESGFRERARSFDGICEAAATSVRSIERTESRLAALEAELSSGIQAVSQLRGGAPPRPESLPGGPEAWPLEGVMRLHEELRQSGDGVTSLPSARGDSASLLTGRVESLELAVTVGQEELTRAAESNDRQRRRATIGMGVLAILAVAAGGLALGSQRRLDARLNEAAARVAAAQQQADAATQLASQQVAAAQKAGERQIAEAHQTARGAQIVSDVLAAPDLVRFYLPGAAKAPRSSAQLLWSRSRGLVLSGSRMPAAPAGTTSQLWLLTNAQPVSAGQIVPDAQGRVSLVTDQVPRVPRRVVGAAVTTEPTGGLPLRSSAAVLARALAARLPPNMN